LLHKFVVLFVCFIL